MALVGYQIASLATAVASVGYRGGKRLLRYEGILYFFCIVPVGGVRKLYCYSSSDGESWSPELVLDSPANYILGTAVTAAIDSVGTFHVSFKAGNQISGFNEILYVSGTPATWGSSSVIGSPAVTNLGDPDLVVDSADQVLVIWTEDGSPNCDVVLQVIGGSQSVITTVLHASYGAKIIAGAAGKLYVSLAGDLEEDYSFVFYYGYFDGASWAFESFDPATFLSPDPFAGEAHLLLGGDGTIHIFQLYFGASLYEPHLFHFYKNGGSWSTPEEIFSEATTVDFYLGNPTEDADGVVYIGFTSCPLLDSNLDPPSTMLILKYDAVWSTAETYITPSGFMTLAPSLISPVNENPGFVGAYDYCDVIDPELRELESSPWFMSAETAGPPPEYPLEFFYDGVSQGSESTGSIFIPLVTDDVTYKLIGVKNISGNPILGIELLPASAHGNISVAVGASGEVRTDAIAKTYNQSVVTPPVANNALVYVWLKWENVLPRFAGMNTIQFTVKVY